MSNVVGALVGGIFALLIIAAWDIGEIRRDVESIREELSALLRKQAD